MSELRGQPFAFVALMLLLWTSMRIALPETDSAEKALDAGKKGVAPGPAISIGHDAAVTGYAAAPPRPLNLSLKMPPTTSVQRQRFLSTRHGLPPALVPRQVGGWPSGLPMPLRVAGDGKPLSAGRDTPPTIALALAGKAGTPELLRQKRWDIYAYSFWRASGAAQSILGPSAQYGGSQAGVIATIDPFESPDRGVSLLMRGSATPGGDDRELAFGLRWKPGQEWPLTLSAERRLRANEPDRFAAYVAGGFDSISLTETWMLNGFGQAGYVSGSGGGGFFDAHGHLIRPIGKAGRFPLTLGIGAWAGGQKGSARVDIGPTVATKIDPKFGSDAIPILIQLDYRFRIAGNAAPGNGLALTVSTGF